MLINMKGNEWGEFQKVGFGMDLLNSFVGNGNVGVLVLLLIPGFISIKVYELIIPSIKRNWGESTIEAACYGAMNFVVLSALSPIAKISGFLAWVILALGLVVFPALWPIIVIRIRKCDFFRDRIGDPIPTAWDKFFARRECCWLRIHLTNGDMIGGYLGDGSYASGFPNGRDLYVDRMYQIDSDGKFGKEMSRTKGMWINGESIVFIEFMKKE